MEKGEKPQIQELSSQTFETKKNVLTPHVTPQAPAFDWKTAERFDSKFTFLNQGDLVFVNLNFKGYNKESDVHYALSDNELLLEVKD